jgi:hypothetical protein
LSFGVEHLIFAGAAADAMYPWVLGVPAWGYIFGVFLITVSVRIGTRKSAPLAAGVLGATLTFYALLLYVPRIMAHRHDPGPWTNFFGVGSPLAAAGELLAMSGAAWVLAGGRTPGRVLFAGALVIFGIQHFSYSRFLATLVPAWIPWHLFWVELVGAAYVAAAAGIATDKAAGLAAFLAGSMFGLIVLLLHVPRVAAAVLSLDEWNSAIVAVAMTGGSFVLADASKRRTEGPRDPSGEGRI